MNKVLIPIYYNREDLAAVLSLSESSIEKLVRSDPTFPKPRVLTPKRVGWLVREVNAWAESRPVSELPPPPNTGAKKSGANSGHQ